MTPSWLGASATDSFWRIILVMTSGGGSCRAFLGSNEFHGPELMSEPSRMIEICPSGPLSAAVPQG
jgi:hypothetical protein